MIAPNEALSCILVKPCQIDQLMVFVVLENLLWVFGYSFGKSTTWVLYIMLDKYSERALERCVIKP